MKHKVGESVRLSRESQNYTGRYAGTKVTILDISNTTYCTVVGYDGRKFACPYSYIIDDNDFFGYEVPKAKCICGAVKTYGEDCPDFFHYPYCPRYRPREENK